jgi:hypothetical protein
MAGVIMEKDKSLMQRFADTVRDVAKTATEAASAALQPETPAASKVERRAAAYVPLAADGLVSDPLMVPPMPQPRSRRRKRAAPKRAAKKTAKTTRKPAKKSTPKSSAKSAGKSAARASGRAASRKAARKTKTAAKQRVARPRRR